MVAEVFLLKVRSGRTDELIRAVQDWLAPAVAGSGDFYRLVLLTEEGGANAIVVTLWTSEAALFWAERGESYREALGRIEALSARHLRRQVLDVSVLADLAPGGTLHLHGI